MSRTSRAAAIVFRCAGRIQVWVSGSGRLIHLAAAAPAGIKRNARSMVRLSLWPIGAALTALCVPLFSSAASIGLSEASAATQFDQTPGSLRSGSARLVVYRRSAPALAGWLHHVSGDTLVLIASNAYRPVAVDDLDSINVLPRPTSTRGAAFGLLGGLYLGNVLFYRGNGSPSAYWEPHAQDNNIAGDLAINALFIGGGGLLGYLVGLVGESEAHVSFAGDEGARRLSLARLRRITTHGELLHSVNFSVQGGFIAHRTVNRAKTRFQDAGFYICGYSRLIDEYDTKKVSNLNLMRRLDLSYGITSRWEAGLAVMWIGEPLLWGGKQDASFRQEYDVTAVVASARRHFWPSRPDGPGRLSVGAGVGLAVVDFSLATAAWQVDESAHWQWIVESQTMRHKPLIAVLSLEFAAIRSGSLSLDLTADYVVGPSYTVDTIPQLGVGKQRLRVGNSSIGFGLSKRF